MKNLQRSALSIYFLCFTLSTQAQDTVYENPSGTNIDTGSFPTTPGFTVLNIPAGGAGSNFYLAGPNSSILYPNGLTINSGGAGLFFTNPNINIANYLTIDDANIGTGLVTMYSNTSTHINGDVHLVNSGQLKFITHNTGSSTTRLHTDDAYFNLDLGTKLHVEFKLDSTTGQYISLGAIEGDGDIALTNVGASNHSGTIYVQNKDGQDYTYSGNISYENQQLPELTKNGSGRFTFTGDVNKVGGDSLGFTDGFGFIEVNAGELQLSSEAFVYGTHTVINGGSLIFDQSTDADIPGARFEGTGGLIKRDSSTITLHGITEYYRGDLKIEDGTLGLAGGATLRNASSVSVDAASTLDISNVYTSTSVSRLYGNGNVELGTKTLNNIIQLSPGDRNNGIGTLSVTGSGTLDLSGTKLTINMDPTQGAGDLAGVTHDQLQVTSSVRAGTLPLISLVDNQAASSPSAFLGGREFTVVTAGSGLSMLSPADIVEDAASFHAFVGADPEKTIITDQSVKVTFGIKSVQQVATTVSQTPTPTTAGSTNNKHKATQQYLHKTTGLTGLTGNQTPTVAQLTSHPALQNLTSQGLAIASSQNNPEAYSSNLTIGLEATDLVSNMALSQASRRHLAHKRSSSGKGTLQSLADNQNRIWLDTNFTDGSVQGASGSTGNFDYDIFAIALGTDLLHNETRTTGIFIGGAFSRLKEHDHINQDIDGNYFILGAYDQYHFENDLRLSSVANLFYGHNDSSRLNYIPTGGVASSSQAEFASYGITLGGMLEKSYTVKDNISLTPSLGLLYTYLKQDGFTESGGGSAYDYSVDSSNAHALLLSTGCEFTHSHQAAAGEFLTKLRIRYEYDAYADQNSAHDIQASLAGIPKSTFVGQNRGPHGILLGLGFETAVAESCQLGAGYTYSWRSHGHESNIGGTFTYFW